MEIKDLLAYKNYVVLGSTTKEEKPAYEIKNLLIEKGYNVRCVGKELESINLVDFDIDVLVIAMNPGRSVNFIQETNKSIKAVIIQPGAESEELEALLASKNIPYVEGCILCTIKDNC